MLEGILSINNNTALGTVDGGTTVLDGATLHLSAAIAGESLVIGGNGFANQGALTTSGTSSWTGSVTLTSNTSVAPSTLTISGPISDVGAGYTLTKIGTGSLILSGANSYSGATTVAQGRIQAVDGVGLPAASNLVLSGGTFLPDGTTPTFTRAVGGGPGQVQWTSSGGFSAGTSAVTINLGGNATPDTLTWGAGGFVPDGCALQLTPSGSGGSINFKNPIDLAGGDRQVVGASATLSGVLSNGSVTIAGASVTLKAANIYTGTTTVNGTLKVGQADAIPSTSPVTVASGGTLDIGSYIISTGTLTLTGGTVTGTTGVLTAPSYDLRKGTVSACLGGSGGVTKTTADSVSLSGANSYTGPTVIAAGSLNVANPSALGTTDNGTTVQYGASLSLGGSTITEPLTLMGGGTGSGALSGSGTWAGPITLADDSGVRCSSSTLTLSGPIGDGGAGYGLVTGGSQTIFLSGANTYTGTTTVTSGTLKLGANDVFADAAPITINQDPDSSNSATFDISTFSDTVGQVILVDGLIQGSTGVLSASNVELRNGSINAILGGAGTVTKTSPSATASLTNANTYTGTTTVAEGVLKITNANALGSTAEGTTVQTGGALEVYNSSQYSTLTMAAEPLTLNGQGVDGNGALRQTSYNTVWTGPVTLGENAAIGVDSSLQYMTISGAVGDAGLARGFTKVGAGYLMLAGSATYTGPTIISQGTVRVIPSTSMSSGNLVFNGGLLQTTGTYTFSRALGSSPGQVQWTGSGGFGSRDGPLTVNIGGHTIPDTLVWGSQYFVPDGSELLFTSTGRDDNSYLGSNYTTEMLNPIDFGGKNRSIWTGWVSSGTVAVLSGALTNGSLTKNGLGYLVLKSPDNSLSAINVNSGRLLAAANGALGANADITITYDSILDISTFNQTVRSVTLNGGFVYGTSPAVLTSENIDLRRGSVTAILDGTGGLTKSTSDSATLRGANIYRGVTRVLEGNLYVENSTALGSALEGTVVSDGASLILYYYDSPVTISGESLTLYGAGVSGIGALQAQESGSPKAWNGPIMLGSDVTIGAWNVAKMMIGGVVAGSYGLTVWTNTDGQISLTAENQYTGPTHIKTNSRLRITNSLALGPSTADVTVDANAKLQMDGNITVSSRTLVLNGGGIETLSGTGTWNGPIYMTATSGFDATSSALNICGPIDDGGPQIGVNIGGSGGVVVFNAANHYTGTTKISGLLRAIDGVGMPTASNLLFSDGVFESLGGGTFTRSLGTGIGQVQWESSRRGGFSASGDKLTVNLGGNATPDTLTWGVGNFLRSGYYLNLGSTAADSEVEFRNPLNLAGTSQGIRVDDNPATNADFATVSGVISNGSFGKWGDGLLRLTAANTYTGYTNPGGGALRAVEGVGLPTASNLKFASTSAGGVLEGEGPTLMLRGLGTGAGQVQWTSSGGFSASGGKMTVAIGGLAAPTPLVWGSGGFVPSGYTLMFGSPMSDSETEFKNTLNLNGATRTVTVNDNPFSSGDFTTLSGVLSNGALTKDGAGTLVLSATNNYTGATTIKGGALRATQGTGLPSNSNLVFSGGVYECSGADFTRSLGTGAGQVQWTGSGGFSAYGGKLTVNIGGNATPSSLTWGATNFVPGGSALCFGSYLSDREVEFLNPINLNNAVRRFLVHDNPATAADFATLSGVLSNGGLSKIGTGTLALPAPNTYQNTTYIYEGTLRAADGVGLPTASNLSFGALGTSGYLGGTLEGRGPTTFTRSMGTGAGQVQWNYSGGFSASGGKTTVAIGGLAAPTPLVWGSGGFVPSGYTLMFGSPMSNSETEFKNSINLNGTTRTVTVNDNPFSSGDFATISGVLSNGGLLKDGPGTLVLSGANTYTGATTVNAGKLFLNGTNATPTISVAGGATLGGSGFAASATATVADTGFVEAASGGAGALTLAGLTFSGSGTVKVATIGNYTSRPAVNVTATDGLTVSGGAGSVTLTLSGTGPTGVGTAHMIHYAGNVGGTGTGAFILDTSALISGTRATYSLDTSTSGHVDVDYDVDRPVWSGAGDGKWITYANPTPPPPATANWTLASNPSTPTNFIANDAAVFDDTASGTTTVDISDADVAPASVTFNNISKNYTLQGAYGITGSALLTKSGSGSVTLSTANSYTGATTLNAGTLNINNAQALGTGTFTISGGTTIDNTSGSAITNSNNNAQVWNGDFTFTGANDLNLGTGAVTLTGNCTVTVSANTLTLGGTIDQDVVGRILTKAGAGTLVLAGARTDTGTTTVTGGILRYSTCATPSTGSIVINGGDITIDDGVTLTSNSGSNGAIQFSTTNNINKTGTTGALGFVTTTSRLAVTVDPGVTGTISAATAGIGNVSGAGNKIDKLGSGKLILSGNVVLVGDVNAPLDAGFTVEGGGELEITGALKAASTLQFNRGNFDNLIGETSGNNTLTISGAAGTTVYAGGLRVGVDATGGNSIVISRPGTSATPSYTMSGSNKQLNLGVSSSNNSLTVSNGAYVYQTQGGGSNGWTLGINDGADNNSILITGAGSTINRGGAAGSAIYVGAAGDSNSVTVQAGGQLIPRRIVVGSNGGDSNYVLVTGASSLVDILSSTNAIFEVGASAGACDNYVLVQDRASLSAQGGQADRSFGIGTYDGADRNYIRVTGATSTLTITPVNPLSIGGLWVNGAATDSTAADNHLDVYSGATATLNAVYLQGVGAEFNLGDGTGISTATVAKAANYATPGVTLANASSELNINSGRLTAGIDGAMVSGAGQVNLNGPAYFSTTFSGSTIDSVIAGAGSLTKEGAGTLTITGANTYSGNTAVNVGKLYLNGTNANTPAISVAGGTTLGGSGSAASATATVANTGIVEAGSGGSGTLTLAGLAFSGTGTVNITGISNYSSSPAVNVTATDGLTVSGAAGSVTLFLSGAAPTGVGTAHLIQYAGDIGGTGFGAFTLDTSALIGGGARAVYSLVNPSGYVDVDYFLDRPVWSGAGDGNWITYANPTPPPPATANWTLANSPSTPTNFIADDAVVFDDTASGTTTVDISDADVAPTSVTFDNSSLTYTLQGAYGITGSAPLTKNGSGSVTLSTANSFTGDTVLNTGALTLGNTGALAGSTLDNQGGTLSFGALAAATLGGLKGTQGIDLRNDSLNAVALTVGGNDQTTTYSGTLSGTGSLIKIGGGTQTLSGANLYTGTTTVNDGILRAGSTTAFGPAANANIAFGPASTGTVQLYGNSMTVIGLNTDAGSPGTTVVENGAASDATLTVDNATANTFAGVLQNGAAGGKFAVTKTGAGILTLSSDANTYTGATSINGGTLSANSLGTGNVFFNNGGKLEFTGTSDTVRLDTGSDSNFDIKVTTGNLSVSRYAGNYNLIVKSGAGTLTVANGWWDDGGKVQVDEGIVVLAGNTNIGVACANVDSITDVKPGATVKLGNSSGGQVYYDYSFTMSGGTFDVNGQNPGTDQNGSVPAISGNGTITNNSATAGRAVFKINGTKTFSGNIVDGTGTLALYMSAGSGTWILSGNNTYSGGTFVNSGILQACSTTAFSPNSAYTVASGRTLNLANYSNSIGSLTGAGSVTLGTATLTIGSDNTSPAAFSGPISGVGGSVIKTGTGTLTLSGTNTYNSGTNVNNGALSYLYTTAKPALGITTVAAGATLGLGVVGTNSFSATDVDNLFAGNFVGNLANVTHTTTSNVGIDTTVGNFTYVSSVPATTRGLNKLGANKLTLTGANAYTGATTVSNGTLLVNNTTGSGTGMGTVTVAGGATLGGTGTIYGTTIISGHHTPGASAGIQTFGSDLTYNAGSDVTWELVANTATQGSPAVFDQIVVGGGLDFAGTTGMTLKFDFTGSAVDWTNAFWDGNQSWLVYDVDFSTSGFDNLSLTVADWADSKGVLLSTAQPGKYFFLSSPTGDDVMLNYLVPGDATLDRNTDFLDYVSVATNYGVGSTWTQGDVTGDGAVDFLDYVRIATNYGSHTPEPATLVLLALGGLVVMRRKRR